MPGFRSGKPWAVGRMTVAGTLPAGDNTVQFDVYEGDPAGWGAGIYTVDRAGLYLVTGGISRTGTLATSSSITARLTIDGVGVGGQSNPGTTGAGVVSVARIFQLEEGDQVSLVANLSPTLTASYGPNQTYLALARIGPVRWTG